ncbi:MAG: response regulator transcription factor [Deltaproteobacteria bacterium]|nr:response regulator transcription factor [Deltaproteobacteria bacterium]
MAISVFVVDDHVMVRQALVQVLRLEADIQVVGDGDGSAGTIAKIQALKPDVTVLDLEMPGLRGTAVISILKKENPDGGILVCSMHSTYAHVSEAIRSGADGYVLKSSPVDLLLTGIRRVAAGEGHIDPSLQSDVIRLLQREPAEVDAELTTREIEALKLAANGLSNEEIGATTGQSVETVKLRFRRSFRKLGAVDRANAVAVAMRRGLIP